MKTLLLEDRPSTCVSLFHYGGVVQHLLLLGSVKTTTKTAVRGRKNQSPRFTTEWWIIECSSGVLGLTAGILP
jgi:hypothetical protein